MRKIPGFTVHYQFYVLFPHFHFFYHEVAQWDDESYKRSMMGIATCKIEIKNANFTVVFKFCFADHLLFSNEIEKGYATKYTIFLSTTNPSITNTFHMDPNHTSRRNISFKKYITGPDQKLRHEPRQASV
jgi:hypothetical protein